MPYGPWCNHVDSYTSKKNVYVLHYEDLLSKPQETIKGLSKFLGKDLDDKKLQSIQSHCSFDNMKNNPMCNYEWNKEMGLFRKDGHFFRKGKIGDWLEHFSPSQSKQLDAVVEANLKYKGELEYGISNEDVEKIYSAAANNIKPKK